MRFSALRRAIENIRGRGDGDVPSRSGEVGLGCGPLLQALSVRFEPSPAFVNALEGRIRAAYSQGAAARGTTFPRLRVNRLGAALALAFVAVAVSLTVVWSLGLLTPAHRIQFEPEKAFAAAYDALLSVHTVSYTVETEINRGICYITHNVQLTEDEWHSLPPDER